MNVIHFYGLNQLPSFISPFTDEFTYEINFKNLLTYLKKQFAFRQQKDSWIYDGIQVYAMMKYIEENHPNTKMLGSALLLLKSYNLTTWILTSNIAISICWWHGKTWISPGRP
jgi:hypothetical protein